MINRRRVLLDTAKWYGAMWESDLNTNRVPIGTGRVDWLQSLPIHNNMRRCIITTNASNGNYSVRYVHPDNYLYDTLLQLIDYSKTREVINNITYYYDIMVEIPEHYCENGTEIIDGVSYNYIKLYPYAKIGKKVPLHYIGAFKAMRNSVTSELFSCCKVLPSALESSLTTHSTYIDMDDLAANSNYAEDAANYIGGEPYTGYNGTYRTQYGRPCTKHTIAEFVTYAKNKNSSTINNGRGGHAIINWAARNCLCRLFIVEYASFDSLTMLGMGMSNANFDGTAWNNYNQYYPTVPCGITLSLGSRTGYIGVKLHGSNLPFSCVSYRGIENPFGDIWEITNGMLANGLTIYTIKDNDNCDDWYIKDFTASYDSSIHKQKVTITGDNSTSGSAADGWIKKFVWDSDGDFVVSTYDKSSDNTSPSLSILRDYCWPQNSGYKQLVVGGSLRDGSRAGLFAFSVHFAVSNVSAHGSRLLYLPVED